MTEQQEKPKLRKKDVVSSIQGIIDQIEQMPPQAMIVALNHYDYMSILFLLRSVLELSCKDEI